MSLKTFVKVGKITNLSDARYCSGMGVDMLGFRVRPSDADYISPDRFKEFRGWFTGPAVVAEAWGLNSNDELNNIIDTYQPDYIELKPDSLEKINAYPLPIILTGTHSEIREAIKKWGSLKIEYMLLTDLPDIETLRQICLTHKVLVALNEEDDLNKIENFGSLVTGISLHGTPEEKPGLKTYDVLGSVLEKLEAAD